MLPKLTELSLGLFVLRLVSMANSRTERLCVLLPASIRSSCSKINAILNSSRAKTNNEKIAALASNRRNMVGMYCKVSFQVCIVKRVGLRLD